MMEYADVSCSAELTLARQREKHTSTHKKMRGACTSVNIYIHIQGACQQHNQNEEKLRRLVLFSAHTQQERGYIVHCLLCCPLIHSHSQRHRRRRTGTAHKPGICEIYVSGRATRVRVCVCVNSCECAGFIRADMRVLQM